MNTRNNNDFAPFPLFLAAALFILAGPVFWMGVEAPGRDRPGLTPENADLYLEIGPVMHYGFGRVRAGELPLWNDRQLCGVPFFANPVHGLLQPLNLGFFFLETPTALALHAFLALALMGFFMLVFLRSLGAAYVPATLGGIVYACCGATAAAMSRPGIANALVWMPLLCWILRVHAARPRPGAVLMGGVVLALLWLSGSPLMALVVSGFCGVYALALAVLGVDVEAGGGGTRRARLGGLLLMLVIAIALTCIQWLPTVVWAMRLEDPMACLTRFAVAGRSPGSMPALIAHLLRTRTSTLPSLGYVGVSTLLLLPAAFFHRVPRWERGFLGLAPLALWSAIVLFGGGTANSPWTALVYPASFATAALAGLGADRLFTPRRTMYTPRLWGPLLLVCVVFLVVFIIAPAATRGRMIPIILAVAVFALFRTGWASALSGAILIVFLFVDLNAASVNYHSHPFFGGTAGFPVSREAATLMHNAALDDRVMVSAPPTGGPVHPNIGMTEGVRVVGGAGFPLTPAQTLWWRAMRDGEYDAAEPLDISADAPHALLLNVMAARAVATTDGGGLASGSAPGLRLRRQGDAGNVTVYVNENAVPRLSWAASWRLALDMPAAMDVISETSFDPRRECVVLPTEPGVSHLARTAPDSRAIRERPLHHDSPRTHIATRVDRPERLVVAVENAAPGVLVVSDTYAPGWRAYVNGQRVPILQTNGLFRGIALSPGAHTVTFEYQPRDIIAGAAISAATLCLLLLALLAAPFLRHSPRTLQK